MSNLTTFPVLNIVYNDPTTEGLSISSPNEQDFATEQLFSVEGFTSLGSNSTPVKYLTVSGSNEIDHMGIHLKGFIQNVLPTATGINTGKAITFEQIYCHNNNDSLTRNFQFSYINDSLNGNVSPRTGEMLYNYEVGSNYIEYNSTTNVFDCYLALSQNHLKLIKGTYLLI